MKYTFHPDFRKYSRSDFEDRLGAAIIAEQVRIDRAPLSKHSRLMVEEKVTLEMEQEKEANAK